ncbi:MAG: pyridoxal phosphate-dependent aminotransferase [Clostridium sp.]|nr:pyridoxal phosphate-dependent aminotransferase [Clostridium sp.]
MKYNFDELIDRRGTNSYKWDSRPDVPEDTIPLWVADMDFRAAPAIIEALQRRIDMGVFGYTFVPDSYYKALCGWFAKWHGWNIDKDMVIYTSGVVPAISAIIKALTKPGYKVLVQTPVYNCFFSSIRNNGCTALENNLILEGENYRIDFDDLQVKAADPQCTLMLLCNPHNPAGRVWTKEELERIDEICRANGVIVVSDEIHCELVFPGYKYTPYATVASERWISCVSPSKAFNIAGLQIANIVCSDAELRAKVDRAINDNEVCDVNPFGIDALIAAYDHSRDWLEQLLAYIHENYRMLREMAKKMIPEFPLINLEGTYLAWLDCRQLGIPSEELEEMLIRDAHVWVNAGKMYGEAGEGFLRINLACPRARLRTGLERMFKTLKEYSNKQ